MRKKAIGVAVAVGALAVTVFIPAAGAQTYGEGGVLGASGTGGIFPITGKTKLKKKVPVATIICGTPGTCSVTASSAKIKVKGQVFKAKFKPIGTIAPGQSVTAKVKLKESARSAIQDAGKGKVKWNLKAHSTDGPTASGSGKRKLTT